MDYSNVYLRSGEVFFCGSFEEKQFSFKLEGGREVMAGICSRISGGWCHRRAQNSIDPREPVSPNVQLEGVCAPYNTGGHGIDEQSVEFKPVEPPMEPVISDQPVACPLPEPSILNDGTIWKEKRTSAAAQPRTNLLVLKEGVDVRTTVGITKHNSSSSGSTLASSPKQNIVTCLEEGKSHGSQITE